MSRVILVNPGTMPTRAAASRPNACDGAAVQAAHIPATAPMRFNGGARRARSTGGNAFIYAAAVVQGFRYPNQFREPGPGTMWASKHAQPGECKVFKG